VFGGERQALLTLWGVVLSMANGAVYGLAPFVCPGAEVPPAPRPVPPHAAPSRPAAPPRRPPLPRPVPSRPATRPPFNPRRRSEAR
jgi:hypothetical protein